MATEGRRGVQRTAFCILIIAGSICVYLGMKLPGNDESESLVAIAQPVALNTMSRSEIESMLRAKLPESARIIFSNAERALDTEAHIVIEMPSADWDSFRETHQFVASHHQSLWSHVAYGFVGEYQFPQSIFKDEIVYEFNAPLYCVRMIAKKSEADLVTLYVMYFNV